MPITPQVRAKAPREFVLDIPADVGDLLMLACHLLALFLIILALTGFAWFRCACSWEWSSSPLRQSAAFLSG